MKKRSLSPSHTSPLPWQSRQLFSFGGVSFSRPRMATTRRGSEDQRNRQQNSVGKFSFDKSPSGHHDKKQYCQGGRKFKILPRALAAGPKVQKRHGQHHQPAETEEQHADHFAFQPLDAPDMRGQMF